jgi:hypothetical protein
MTVVTLLDYTPPPRVDGLPWVSVELQEALDIAGTPGAFAAIDTLALDPPDDDPSDPAPRSFTTEAALLADGWYRAVWIDASGDRSRPTEPRRFLPWAPTIGEVARVTPAYTRGGFDDDEHQSGREHGVYDHTTTPSAAEVADLIGTACDEIAGRVGVPIPPRCFALARITARWHVAAAISAGKIPAGTDDAGGEYRSHIGNYRACLDELILQARARTILPA